MNTDTDLYFAYGSNLNTADWEAWCRQRNFNPESIQPLFPAWMPDSRVGFTYHSRSRGCGVLDLLPAVGCVVPGVVFKVKQEGWNALDTKEGHPSCYHRVTRRCLTWDGQAHEVQTYVVLDNLREPFVQPSQEYINLVKAGLEKFQLSCEHLDRAVKNLPPQPVDGLFVYGTLLRGEVRHAELGKLHCALLAEAPGRLLDCGAYPAMCLPDPDHRTSFVQGEFVRLRDINRLTHLDQIEGFNGFEADNSLFRRALIKVGMCDGRIREGWVYLGCPKRLANCPEIESGDWREHKGSKRTFLRRLVVAHCGADERALVRAFVNSRPFPPDNEDRAIEALLPLDEALARGAISERQLAQVSGKWTACSEAS